jgi:hypothetical protein
MNGYEELKSIIYKQLVSANANIPGIGRNKFSKDLAKRIYETLEPDMNKQWNLVHNFPEECEEIARRLERGLKFNLFPRNAEAQEIYEWIIEQEAQGFKLQRFIGWALHPDRIKYAGKYRSKPMYIKADYPQAFTDVTEKPQTILERA